MPNRLNSFVRSEKDNIVFEHVQKVDDIYLANQEDRKKSDEKWNVNKDTKHVARIPMVEYLKLQKAGITSDKQALFAAIEANPEWKATTKILI